MDYINGMILKSIYRIFFHQLEFKHGSSLIRIISVRIFSSIPFIFPAIKILHKILKHPVIYNNRIFFPYKCDSER